ncbi:hypothetical protein A359_01370 [secondary endosymbiont of Ctenarytaina eucalypti]|uniref:Uncharacterized protein n=1 Tax=secondary endosymbiont of Ctenarytaina eucalypti TaxID=1199245 RepID=J3TWX4_9ENTR|nr:hypothetical protein A359_01370 [secondary endosymbiont of Ctenarytaina eucalypti]
MVKAVEHIALLGMLRNAQRHSLVADQGLANTLIIVTLCVLKTAY